MTQAPLLQVRDLSVGFQLRQQRRLPWQKPPLLRAVEQVGFDLMPGQTLGVVGESGSGKSTLARALVGLVPAKGHAIWQDGTDLIGLSPRRMMRYRRDIQMIFQAPQASLNPRMALGQIIAEPLVTHFPRLSRRQVRDRVATMIEQVGLSPDQINRYPHEFSGGQCQRIAIARALIVQPKLVICDEPVSALDVSIQAQIINLLSDLQRDLGLALIFIGHDLAVVNHISDQVLVIYLGRVMEIAPAETLYHTPLHPYTQALMAAVPLPDPTRTHPAPKVGGDLPSPLSPPSGCVFRTRCPRAADICARMTPPLTAIGNHRIACHFTGPAI